jgi:transposase InsO family protein
MRFTQSEKMEIIRLVQGSQLGVKRTLEELDVPRSSFYRWYRRYRKEGYDGLANRSPNCRRFWNKIPDCEKQRVIDVALAKPELTPRELAWEITDGHGTFISESSVYRILRDYDLVSSPAYIVLSASDEFKHKTSQVNQLWQTDFTYFKIIGWGWYYLSTVLDDYSRYIIAWLLTKTMAADDVKKTLELALNKTGVSGVEVRHRPRLLSDNGPCYLAGELGDYLDQHGIEHTRGRPYHPMTQGKIERYHRTMKNVINLEHYYLPWQLEHKISEFVQYYNHQRVHESLDNLTPADVYHGRAAQIAKARNLIKEQTMRNRRRMNMGLQPLSDELIKPAILREGVC